MNNDGQQWDHTCFHAICVYGPEHVAPIRNLLLPSLARQQLTGGARLVLHLLNYRDNRALLAGEGTTNLEIRDWSAARAFSRCGFGAGVNHVVRLAAPPRHFFLINPDSYPMAECLTRLMECAHREPSAGIIEARQWPSEHPKEYDPRTAETPWASGAFCLISAPAFAAIGGFDPIYFLYNEDVDLSWRFWLAGYRVLYESRALAAHFTGLLSYRPDRFYLEHFFSSRNFLVISYKFFGEAGEARALRCLKTAPFPSSFKEKVEAGYQKIKSSIVPYAGEINCPHIKITGFNQYHELHKKRAKRTA